MIFIPWRRQEPLDHAELARLLPAPGDPVLSDDRQRLLEDHLMSNATEDSRHVSLRRRLAVRVAVPVALAAALAGTALAVNQTTAHTDASTAATAGRAPLHISTAAYTLNRQGRGTVTVTIGKAGAVLSDPAQLQHDLERMGVPARVYGHYPSCPANTATPFVTAKDAGSRVMTISQRHGAVIATVNTDEFPAGAHLVLAIPASPLHASIVFGLGTGKGPDCIVVTGVRVHVPPPAPSTHTPTARVDMGSDHRS